MKTHAQNDKKNKMVKPLFRLISFSHIKKPPESAMSFRQNYSDYGLQWQNDEISGSQRCTDLTSTELLSVESLDIASIDLKPRSPQVLTRNSPLNSPARPLLRSRPRSLTTSSTRSQNRSVTRSPPNTTEPPVTAPLKATLPSPQSLPVTPSVRVRQWLESLHYESSGVHSSCSNDDQSEEMSSATR